MHIAFVRGPFYNPFDSQLYVPLAQRHSFTAIGANWQFFPHEESVSYTVHHPNLWFSRLSRFQRDLTPLANRLLSWTSGRSYGLDSLGPLLRNADVVDSPETFFTLTYQCLEFRRSHPGQALVVTVRENLPHMGETHPWRRARKQAVIREADAFVAITPRTHAMLREDGVEEERIAEVPLSINLQRFSPGPRSAELTSAWALQESDIVVLFVGRFVEEKGIAEILKASAILLVKQPSLPLRFCFVGDGPLRRMLDEARLQQGTRLIIHPMSPYEQMPAIHRMADIFVFPSKPAAKIAEQFGFALVESMASQKPVITTRVGSIPDVVGSDAILIQPGQADALADAIAALALNPARRRELGEHVEAHVRQQYDAEFNSRKLESVYLQAIERAKRRSI